MKIAVTGANSFIGSKLVKKACSLGWDVAAIVRGGKSPGKINKGKDKLTWYECDIDNYSRLGDKVGSVDCLVHLAWNGTRGTARLDEDRQKNNYHRGMDAVKSMADAGCKRFILAGSQAEYGLYNGIITEETPCRPKTAYGKYKVKLFEEAYDFCCNKGAALKEPRFFSLYGPGDYENTVIMSSIRHMRKNAPCRLTQAVQMWDYLYIDDAVDALAILCELDCADGAYNFGSGDCRPLKYYIEELKLILNSSSELLYGAVPCPPTGIVSIQPSVRKLSDETGWMASTSFEQGIRAILDCLN